MDRGRGPFVIDVDLLGQLQRPQIDSDYAAFLLANYAVNPVGDAGVDGGDGAEEEEDDDEDDGGEDEEEGEEEEEETVPAAGSTAAVQAEGSVPRVPSPSTGRTGEQEAQAASGGEGFEVEECSSPSEIEGLCCPICMQAWTSEGDHHICCLPCGHIYGMSCIKKWFERRRASSKCPQCNKRCKLKDVRKLYASRIVVIDEESQKKIHFLETKCASLEAKCASLESKAAGWHEKEAEWLKEKVLLRQQVQKLTERATYLEHLQGDRQSRPLGLADSSCCRTAKEQLGHKVGSNYSRQGLSCSFVLQEELPVDGGRLFDVDASNKILLIARRLPGMGGMHSLTKMSLATPHDREHITLPPSTKAVKDLHVSPNGSLALLASLGKKLSILSIESNNFILTYDLPAPAWSCAWDVNCSHYIYAGLQNGMVMLFDMRQTMGPLESTCGLTCNPVHTLHSLLNDPASTPSSGVSSLLAASAIGLSQWSFGGAKKGPYLIPETENQGVCISLACCPHRDEIVASFRPKVETSIELPFSQPSWSQSSLVCEQRVQGSLIFLKRTGHKSYQKLASASVKVDNIRLPRSAIIGSSDSCFFASEDETGRDMVLQELPVFAAAQCIKSCSYPIRDVKYTDAVKPGLLSCLSGDKLQLFYSELL